MSNYGAPGLAYASDKLTVNLADYDPLADVPAFALATAGTSGAATDTQPVDEHPVTVSGIEAATFRGDLYEREILLPDSIALGNLFAEQVRTVEIWNTHLTEATCSDITGTAVDGLSIDQTAPFSIEALKSVLAELSVSTAGPATINGSYAFTFGDGALLLLAITGQRLIVFRWRPQSPIEESIEWLTDIIEAYDGSEQRAALRQAPRQRFSTDIFLPRNQRAKLRPLLHGCQAQVWGLPLWTEARQLAADLPAGSEAVPIDTQYADYREGGTALLWTDPGNYEAVEIATIAADSLALTRETLQTFAAGAYIMPLRQARAPEAVSVEDLAAGYTRASIDWRVIDNVALTAWEMPTQYQGYGVITDGRMVNQTTTPREVYRPIETVDFDTGIVAVESRMEYSRDNVTKLHRFLDTRQAAWELRRWLHGLAGRCVPFWLPSFMPDVTVAAAFNDTQTDLIIDNIGYARHLSADPMHRHLYLLRTDGTVLLREIESTTENDDGTETLALDSALGFAGGLDTFDRISFMRLVRLSADRIELSWRKPGWASCDLAATGVDA